MYKILSREKKSNIGTVDPVSNDLASARQKKVVGDRKSLVTEMSFCCKICGCGGWFNVGLMTTTFTHH